MFKWWNGFSTFHGDWQPVCRDRPSIIVLVMVKSTWCQQHRCLCVSSARGMGRKPGSRERTGPVISNNLFTTVTHNPSDSASPTPHPAVHPLKTFRNSLAALNLTPPRVQRVRSSGFVLNIVFCLLPSCPSPCCIFGLAVWLLSTFPRPGLFIIPAFLPVHYGRWPPVFAEFSSDSLYRCSFSCPRPSALSGMDCKKQQIKGFSIVWAQLSKTP